MSRAACGAVACYHPPCACAPARDSGSGQVRSVRVAAAERMLTCPAMPFNTPLVPTPALCSGWRWSCSGWGNDVIAEELAQSPTFSRCAVVAREYPAVECREGDDVARSYGSCMGWIQPIR